MAYDKLFLSYLGGMQNNSLSDILYIYDIEINKLQIIRRSSYYEIMILTSLMISLRKTKIILVF